MRISRAVTSGVAAFLVGAGLSGCASDDGDRPAASGTCAPFAEYEDHRGTTVKVSSSIRDVEAVNLTRAWEQFQACTGITIDYSGSADFESALPKLADDKLPDLALFPQPGLIADMARAGKLKKAGEDMAANAERYFSPDWIKYGTVDGTLYGVPVDANVKSFVWYSPKFFTTKGYKVPETWADMLTLSDRIAADGVKPWCAGIESGVATGWPATDWLEDVLLRTAGPETYDAWVEHRIPFDDPKVIEALDRVGGILRNADYVNGGYGDVKSIARTAFQEGGLPILQQKCAMHRQASFYTTWWPATANVSEDGDIYAFYLPPVDPAMGRPVLGAGVFAAAFADRPEVQAVAAYLATPDFANQRATTGNIISANKELDRSRLSTPVSKLAAEILADPKTTFRFDGSDMMPASVGAGSFWTGMTAWINGADTATTLHQIQGTWPA